MANSLQCCWTLEKEVFLWTRECELVTTSNTPNAYKNPLCCKCVYLHTAKPHLLSKWHWETRWGFFSTTKYYLLLVAPVFIWDQQVQNSQQKNPNWQGGQKSPPVDNFMGSLRNILEIRRSCGQFHGKFKELHTTYKSREILVLGGDERKNQSKNSPHVSCILIPLQNR